MPSSASTSASTSPSSGDTAAWLDAPAEAAKREALGAAGVGQAPALSRALAPTSAGPNAPAGLERVSPKVVALLRRAGKAMNAGDYRSAALVSFKAIDADETCALAHHLAGVNLFHLGHLSRALTFYERALELDPSDPQIFQNLGHVAWKLDMLEGAERFFRIVIKMNPTNAEGAINLAGVLRDQGKFDDAVEVLRARLLAEEHDPVLWNSLGTVLLEKGDPANAATFFEEAVRLDPDFSRAWHNIAYARAVVGDAEGSIGAYDTALAMPNQPSDDAEMRHSLAQSLLSCGRLGEGWDTYEIRLSTAYQNATLFLIDKPVWQGEDLTGKHMLLVGEQGLGDEVLFLNAGADIMRAVGPEGLLTLVVEPRLKPLIARSFPGAQILHHASVKREGRTYRLVVGDLNIDGDAPDLGRPVDAWAPFASAVRQVRRTRDAFPKVFSGSGSGFLTPNTDRRAAYCTALDALPGRLKVGVCWKSKLMTPARAKYFSPFTHWKNVLQTSDVAFVSLQYGDTASERAEARETLGVELHELDGLDLMHDLDGVAAAGAAMDIVIGPMNASTNLAMACGAEGWILGHPANWPMLGGDGLPWYPRARVFMPPQFGAWSAMMGDVASALKDRAAAAAKVRAA